MGDFDRSRDLGLWGEISEVETLVISAICSPPALHAPLLSRGSLDWVVYSGNWTFPKSTSFGTATYWFRGDLG